MCFGSAPKVKPVKTPAPPAPPEPAPLKIEEPDAVKKNRRLAIRQGTGRLRIPVPKGGNVNLG